MAKRKEGHEVLFVEAPEGLKERLAAVARHNRRSMTAEAVVAIERYVEAEEDAGRADRERGCEVNSTDNKTLRAGGYERTSGEGQRDNTSILTQKEGVEAACASNGWQLVRHYIDECKSGAKIDGRDAFKRMLKDAMNGELDILVPYDAKRFARDGVDIMETAKMLKGTFGVVVVDSKGQFDNRDHRNTLRNFVESLFQKGPVA